MRGREDRNAFLLALDIRLRGELVLVVGMHAPKSTLPKPQSFLFPGSLHEVLIERKVVTDGILFGGGGGESNSMIMNDLLTKIDINI